MVANTVPVSAWPAAGGRLRTWLRDPFAHFVGIGIVLMALYALVSPPRAPAMGSRIELTDDDLRQIDLAWTAKWQRAPTPAERRGLLEAKVREEILYREAVAMGLDQEDTIVKRRMAQKLEFLTEDVGAIRTPGTQELQHWFARNAAQFATAGHVTFRHVYFSPDRRGQQAARDARNALASLAGEAADTPGIANLGDGFPDRTYYAEQSPEQVASAFGTAFSQSLLKLEPGAWQGPIESGLGWHLVWVDAVTPSRVPAFADVDRKDIEAAWIDEQRAESKRKAFDAMKAKYEVVLPGAGTP
jgi:parvulin-like peptidyl-prolyl isomerase